MIENEAKIIDNYLQYLLVNQIKKEQIVDILDTICILDIDIQRLITNASNKS